MNNLNKISISLQVEFIRTLHEAVKAPLKDGSTACVFQHKPIADKMSDHLEKIGILENGKKKIVAQHLRDDSDWLVNNLGWCILLTQDNLSNLRVQLNRPSTAEEREKAKSFAKSLTECTQTTGKNARTNLTTYAGRTTLFTLRDLATALELYAKAGDVNAKFIPALCSQLPNSTPQSVLEIFQETLDPYKINGVATIIKAIKKQEHDHDIAQILEEILAFLKSKFPE